MKVFKIIYSISLVFFIFSCDKDDRIEGVENTNVTFEEPANFPEPTYNFSKNEFTEDKFELGKRLFYDGILSSDGSVSCAFCHGQSSAFTHHGHALSDGVGGAIGTRNSQPIQNLAFMKDFTWDGSIRNLDLQPLIPIESEVEMDETMANVLTKLRNDSSYLNEFNKAFDLKSEESSIVSYRTVLEALAQFMNALVSANSRYDHYVRGELMDEPYSEDEISGLAVFSLKCASCHSGELFTDQSYRNNGIGVNSNLPDELGRGRVTDEDNGVNSVDYYKFKVPSLRNVWVTFPYMHDGRMNSLNDVLEHYNSGVQEMNTLDELLRKEDGTLGIPLTDEEKRLLKIFLKSLTDETFLTDERFAEN